MPIRQVLVPYRQGYNLGIGADLASGAPLGKSVEGGASNVANAAGANVEFRVMRVQSTEQLEEALGIDAEANYGCAAFGAGVSARFAFAKNTKIQSSSLFMIVTANVQLAFEQIDDPQLSEHADGLLARPDRFNETYGNVFVRGIQRGGLFVGTVRIETESSDQSTEIAAELRGSYGMFSAEAKVKFQAIQQRYNCSVYVDMYHEGGPVELQIKDPTNPSELLENANRFLQSFRERPAAEVARPYYVTLAPISIARSRNDPLNAPEIQHAQDVLIACSKARSRILDKLNLIEFILSKPEAFTFPEGLKTQDLARLQGDFEYDLDTVARCAGNAINHPKDAPMPAEYAEMNKRGQYPKGTLPENLPAPKAGKQVAVPDFRQCASWDACHTLAAQVGLVAQRIFAPIEPDKFKVLDFAPPFGTNVPENSVINITTQSEKLSRFAKLLDGPIGPRLHLQNDFKLGGGRNAG